MVSNFDGLNGTYGAFEIGVLVATFLYGIETLQTYNYFRRFPKDSSLLKATVAVTWCLELGQSICDLHALYSGTITFYGKAPLEEIAKPPRSVILEMFFSSVSCTVVQLFFGNRIRLLGGNWHIVFLCFLLTIAYLIGSLVLMAELWTSSSVATFLESKLQWQMIVFTSLGPVVDILLALSMSFHLWRLRDSGPQFKWTRRTLDTLLLWTVETAVLTSFAAIIQLVLYLVRTDLSFVAFYSVQSKLFSNSMLAVLNGRTRFRSHDSGVGIAISDVIAVDLRETSNEPSNNSIAFAPASHSTSENSVGGTPPTPETQVPASWRSKDVKVMAREGS